MIDDIVEADMIICPHCGHPIGDRKNFMFLYMPHDMKCPNCGKVAIHTISPRW